MVHDEFKLVRAHLDALVFGIADASVSGGAEDSIQIIKGWSKSGQSFEKVYDVVWSGDWKPDKATGRVGPVGNTVDLETATYTNTIGSSELKAVWTDPDFDPSLHAFYYPRVLEIPTPRWPTIQAHQLGMRLTDVALPTLRESMELSYLVYAERGGSQEC